MRAFPTRKADSPEVATPEIEAIAAESLLLGTGWTLGVAVRGVRPIIVRFGEPRPLVPTREENAEARDDNEQQEHYADDPSDRIIHCQFT